MEKIKLQPIKHKGEDKIGIYFPMNSRINGALQKTAGAKWSDTDKCRYVPLTNCNYEKIKVAVKGVAAVNNCLSRHFLPEKKNNAMRQMQVLKSKKSIGTASPPNKKLTYSRSLNNSRLKTYRCFSTYGGFIRDTFKILSPLEDIKDFYRN